MITGTFDQTLRRPYVRGLLGLSPLDASGPVRFLLDTGAYDSVLSYHDAAEALGIDHQDLINLNLPILERGGVGGVGSFWVAPARVMFADEVFRRWYARGYEIDIKIAMPPLNPDALPLPSLLGQDILQHWNIIHDFPRKLGCKVKRADYSQRL